MSKKGAAEEERIANLMNVSGLGVSAAIVSYLVALYYNVIITWCLYYLGRSFTLNLPWEVGSLSPYGALVQSCVPLQKRKKKTLRLNCHAKL